MTCLRTIIFTTAVLLLLAISPILISCAPQATPPSVTPFVPSAPSPQPAISPPAPSPTPPLKPAPVTKEVELKYDDGIARDYLASAGGFLIEYTPPATPFLINKVRMIGVLAEKPTKESFEVEICNSDKKVIYNAKFPVTKFPKTYGLVEIEIPKVEVNRTFYAHVFTDTGRLQGIHIGADDSITNEHSTITMRGLDGIQEVSSWTSIFGTNSWFSDKKRVNWMIRVVGTYLEPDSK